MNDVEDVEAVVFPTADHPSVCTLWLLDAETIIVLPEYPTEAIPAPLIEKLELKVVELVDPVVFPTALHPSVWTDWDAVVAPDIIIDWPLNPTDTPPAPLREKLLLKLVEEVPPVVLPTALYPSVCTL